MRAFNAVVTTVACYVVYEKIMFRVQQAGPPPGLGGGGCDGARRGVAARMSDLLLRVWIFNSADFVISSPRTAIAELMPPPA